MTKEELVNLLENSGRTIHLSKAFTTNNENKIIQEYVDYSPTTQTIFKLETRLFEVEQKLKSINAGRTEKLLILMN